jgi:hypothetical protein
MQRIERHNRERFQEVRRASRSEQQAESDESVTMNLSPELVPLWEKVKRSIKSSPRMSRLDTFLQYAESHPSEILESIESRTDDLIRDLERREQSARRALSGPFRVPRSKTSHSDGPNSGSPPGGVLPLLRPHRSRSCVRSRRVAHGGEQAATAPRSRRN